MFSPKGFWPFSGVVIIDRISEIIISFEKNAGRVYEYYHKDNLSYLRGKQFF
jgi:hypothetical protein